MRGALPRLLGAGPRASSSSGPTPTGSTCRVERYLERCRLKTGVLFAAACELGALAAGEDPGELGRFGDEIGVAFQILDDVLDISGPAGAHRQAAGRPTCSTARSRCR